MQRTYRALSAAILPVGVLMAGAVTAGALAADMPAGDADRGQKIYDGTCTGCHSLDKNRIGPRHRGVVGRKAGSIADFNYSPALKAAGFTWTPAKLDTWLTNPAALVPGTKMGFRLDDAQKRADVIAYLERAGKEVPKK